MIDTHLLIFITLIILGEKLTKEEAKGLMKELCDPEDDEGFMPFMRKYLELVNYFGVDKTRNKISFITKVRHKQ